MIFSKSTVAAVALMLGASLQVEAHAAISPMLGLNRTPQRNDALRPSSGSPCGNVNIASTFDTSQTIPVKSDRTFQATITNFNAGVDGSRQIVDAQFDITGTGKNFQPLKTLINGQNSPTEATGSEQIFFQLRHGLDCAGGARKNKCLVSFKTAGGFGNCVVVEQSKAGARRRMERARVARGTRADGAVFETTVVDGETQVRAVGPQTSVDPATASDVEASATGSADLAATTITTVIDGETQVIAVDPPVFTTDDGSDAGLTTVATSVLASATGAPAVSTVTVTETVSVFVSSPVLTSASAAASATEVAARALPVFARDY